MKNIALAITSALLLTVTVQAQTRKTVPAQAPARKMVTPAYSAPATSYSNSTWGHNATGFQNELDLNLSQGSLKTYKVGSKSYTDINLFASYSYDLGNNIQVGGDAGLQSLDSSTYLTIAATGTYNLDANYSDSIFFKGGVGLYPVNKGSVGNNDIKNEFGLYVAAGKRFKIWDHVNYKPMLAIAKISDLDAQITIMFLNVSVNWN